MASSHFVWNMSYSLTKEQNPGASIFYDPGFLNVLQEHIPHLLATGRYRQITLEPNQALAHKGDFNALLVHLKIPFWHHLAALWMNAMVHPSQFDGRTLQILLPEQDGLVEIMRLYQTHQRAGKKK